MTVRTLIRRSLRFHWRSHLGVVLGAAIGSAALIGALIVGDSVRETLRARALERLGLVHVALDSGDRLFAADLPQRIQNTLFQGSPVPLPSRAPIAAGSAAPLVAVRFSDKATSYVSIRSTGTGTAMIVTTPLTNVLAPFSPSPSLPSTNLLSSFAAVLHATATAASADGTARANQVNVYGVNLRLTELGGIRPPMVDETILNERLAAQLGARVGDSVLLRVRKPEAVSAESPVSATDASVALRLRVTAIVPDDKLGNLSLRANQVPPYNAFVALSFLQSKLGLEGRANQILVSAIEEASLNVRLSLFQRWGRKLNASWVWTRPKVLAETNALPEDASLRRLERGLRQSLTLDDLQIQFRSLPQNRGLDAHSSRIFIEPALGDLLAIQDANDVAQRPARILTYLVNQFRAGELTTPYSMATAADSRLLPPDLRDDEIVINQWLADDLKAGPGTEIAVTYFLPDQVSQRVERTNRFRVRAVIPMNHPLCDRTLMPDFPGIAKAEHAGDWDTSFPLVHKIRPKDDEYWQQYRGTPKAFVSLRAGQSMWANRFGNLTALRWEFSESLEPSTAFWRIRNAEAALKSALSKALAQSATNRTELDPAAFGFQFQPVRQQALAAASQSQDFGGLFIGFSLFLILAALILIGLLFQFGVEQRAAEIGTLLALGFRAKQVRRLFLREGAALAFMGSAFGVFGGIAYARAMLHGLTTVWRSATNTSALLFHVSAATILIGLASAVVVAAVTIWLVLRKQARQPARSLLAGEWKDELHESPSVVGREAKTRTVRRSKLRGALSRLLRAPVIACGSMALAVATVIAAFAMNETSNPEYFFSAGSLALIAGLALVSWLLARMLRRPSAQHVSSSSLSVRGAARRKTRSVATAALLACGVFLIVAIGAFRLDAEQDAWKRSSGTGGFALVGESTLPIVKDLNTSEGRDALGLDEKVLQGVSFVPFRVRDGDDASCLNLNRAQQPRLLGVKAELLSQRFAFSSLPNLSATPMTDKSDGWLALNGRGFHLTGSVTSPSFGDNTVPAIGDSASIQWALGKKIGDALTYQDERGNSFDVRLVGGLANSILQGSLIIDEAELTRRFPSVSGHRMFLIDCPSNALPQVSAELTRALQDYGFEVTPAAQRLAAFNAVQNTYLSTFQVLGGLGLLLGSAGLGIVVLRNVLERRGELALLIAVGFRRARVQKLVLAEHAALLCFGLLTGIVSALVAILPSLLSPRGELPVQSLALTLGGVLLFGMLSTWVATRAAVRGNLLEGLRNE